MPRECVREKDGDSEIKKKKINNFLRVDGPSLEGKLEASGRGSCLVEFILHNEIYQIPKRQHKLSFTEMWKLTGLRQFSIEVPMCQWWKGSWACGHLEGSGIPM